MFRLRVRIRDSVEFVISVCFNVRIRLVVSI